MPFSQLEEECEEHIQDSETKRCFCDVTGKNCNMYNCPKLRDDEGQATEEA